MPTESPPVPSLDFHRVKPLVVAVDMGYGHIRAARPIARALGTDVTLVDQPPLVGPDEKKVWDRVRTAYEWTSRASQVPLVGRPFRWMLDSVTDIPHLHPYRDLSAPDPRRGHARPADSPRPGEGARRPDARDRGAAPRHLLLPGHRRRRRRDWPTSTAWSPTVTSTGSGRRSHAAGTGIRYLVPSPRAARRLRSYGVPEHRISFTGFPLPHELVGGRGLLALRRNLAARLVRLDPSGTFRRDYREELAQFLGPLPEAEEGRPPTLTFAVGGAGAQAELARQFLPGVRRAVEAGRLRVALVAGVRSAVEARFREELQPGGHGRAPRRGAWRSCAPTTLDEYFDRFDATMARTDALWTKPSELSFYAALGLPLIFTPPVGVHERYNRRWVRESGAGLVQRHPAAAWQWFSDWLEDGTLAGAAWSGFTRLPKHGLYRILDEIAPPSPVGEG